ncbi:hypothetical protein TCAL_17005 [Tigriopus californicus]|uniref:BTB domain-containing protein n=1 Tax=Tigriopus californicus TaxID=6832 RepID=A0A553PFP0_TIGCA|nr:hypothetical protein TCAL_17005 [Tigriopus californicus]
MLARKWAAMRDDLDRIEYDDPPGFAGQLPLWTLRDTTLIMDDGAELSAHEFVLSAFSSVFNRTFCHLQPDLNDGKVLDPSAAHSPPHHGENSEHDVQSGLEWLRDPVSLRRNLLLQQLCNRVQTSERFKSQAVPFLEDAMINEEALGPRMRRPNAEDYRPRSVSIEE